MDESERYLLHQPVAARGNHTPSEVHQSHLEERQAVSESSVVLQKNDGTHKDVNVTVNVFSEAMEDDIGSLS